MLLLFCSGKKPSTNEWRRFLEIKGRVRLSAFEEFLEQLPKSRSRTITVTIISVCGFIYAIVGLMTTLLIKIGNWIIPFLLLAYTHSCTCCLANSCVCRFDRIIIDCKDPAKTCALECVSLWLHHSCIN